MKIIFDYNRTLFNPDTGNLYPGAFDLLSLLSQNHELFLVSRNEVRNESVLEEFGISNFFIKKVFAGDKTTDLFKGLIGDTEQALVVGDRIRGEIVIGNTLGYITVWVRQGKFMDEFPQTNEEKPDHTIHEINQLLKLVKIYE